MLTGEPIPVAKGVGDAVIGATLNTTGRASRAWEVVCKAAMPLYRC